MASENSSNDGRNEAAEDLWTLDRRTILQLGGAGIASFGMMGASTSVASATTNCADGPFERAYGGETITLSELPAEAPNTDEAAKMDLSVSPLNPLSEDQREARRAKVRGQRPSRDAQQADMEAQRPNGERLRVGSEYDGVNAEGTRGGVPSDSQIATGEDKHIHALNRQVAVFDKDSGEQQLKVQLEDIWEPVIPEPDGGFISGSPFVFDPRARYDRNQNRFILAAVQFQQGIAEDGSVIDREEIEEGADGPGLGEDEDEVSVAEGSSPDPRPPKGYFVVAVSASSDPTGEWHVYRLPPEDADGPDNLGLVDYPTLGLDRDTIYLTQNFFPNDGSNVRVSMVTLDKAAMYDGEAVTAYHFDNLDNPTDDYLDFTVQPALQPFSGGSDGTYYMVNSVFPKTQKTPLASTLTFWEVTNPIDDPSLECFIVEVDPYTSPPNARQPNSEKFIDPVGRRLMNADYNPETGSLWTAHATAIDWSGDGTLVSAIRWYEIDTESRSLVQSGIYGEPGRSYFLPTIGSNDDTTIIAHNVSGPDTFPRMDVAGRTEGFVRNQLEDAVVIEAGESRYNYGENMDVMRWGDYNGVSVDPRTDRFWAVSQYSPDIDIPPEAERRDPYHTRIAEVSFDWWFYHDQ